MAIEEILASKKHYEGRILNLRVDTVMKPSGTVTTREIVEHTDSVVIAAIDTEDNVLLVRQYRSALGKVLVELPAGKTEPDEHHLQTAHRELQEETGYAAKNMEELGGFYAGPGYSTEYLYFYLATDLALTKEQPHPDEIMDVFRVPLSDVPAMIDKGDICDAKSVAGLLRVIHNKK